MENLYETINQGSVGLMESPTGTGKSLSLICGAFKWLEEYKSKPFDDILNELIVSESDLL